ncbi:hypothetical protein GW17_00036146 [Ensete ventricosum]|nr:hypothetical protein GW17_00036146 [Ensete ventricosum]
MGSTYRSARLPVHGPPGTGGTYQSARLPIHGPPTTGRYHQKSTVGNRFRPSAINFGHRRSIWGEKGKKKKKKRKRRKKKKRRRRKKYLFSLPRGPSPSPAGAFSPVQGDGMSPHAGRKIEPNHGKRGRERSEAEWKRMGREIGRGREAVECNKREEREYEGGKEEKQERVERTTMTSVVGSEKRQGERRGKRGR